MRPALLFLLTLVGVSVACNEDTPPVPTTPAPITTENFSGTVQPGGVDVHAFNVALSNGLLTMTLTSTSPPATIIGMAVGQPDTSGTCVAISGGSVNTAPGANPQISGSVNAGSYCSRVYDPGGLTVLVTYSVTVTHY